MEENQVPVEEVVAAEEEVATPVEEVAAAEEEFGEVL